RRRRNDTDAGRGTPRPTSAPPWNGRASRPRRHETTSWRRLVRRRRRSSVGSARRSSSAPWRSTNPELRPDDPELATGRLVGGWHVSPRAVRANSVGHASVAHAVVFPRYRPGARAALE